MNETQLQDKYLVPFFIKQLGYRQVKPNTIDNSLIIKEDLAEFISQTELNKKPYETLLKKYQGDKEKLLTELIELIQERIASSRNMALFINANKSVTLKGIKLHLFYTNDSVIHDDKLFKQNIFSVVQELPYQYKHQKKIIFSFRPDICVFINGNKIMIVVDRLQLRGQIDSKMLNMNIDNRMYVEAHNKKTFQEALKSDTRLVIVNLQKFGAVREMLAGDVLEKLSKLMTVKLSISPITTSMSKILKTPSSIFIT